MVSVSIRTKRLIVCADDYGLNAPVSAGIAVLAARGRLSALTCIVTGPHWIQAGADLKALPSRTSVGLHLNFTEGRFLVDQAPMPTLGRMLVAGAARALSLDRLSREIHAQWDAFERVCGRAPDFIDSHQHVHVLPQLRKALLAAVRARGHGRVAVRNLHPSFGPADSRIKRLVIRVLGAPRLARALDAARIARSGAFGGAQNFDPDADVRAAWRTMLAQAPDGALIACHPASEAPPGDPIGTFRVNECNYLGSDAFAADCAEFGVTLRPLRVELS